MTRVTSRPLNHERSDMAAILIFYSVRACNGGTVWAPYARSLWQQSVAACNIYHRFFIFITIYRHQRFRIIRTGARSCYSVESTSVTLIQRCDNVVGSAGHFDESHHCIEEVERDHHNEVHKFYNFSHSQACSVTTGYRTLLYQKEMPFFSRDLLYQIKL